VASSAAKICASSCTALLPLARRMALRSALQPEYQQQAADEQAQPVQRDGGHCWSENRDDDAKDCQAGDAATRRGATQAATLSPHSGRCAQGTPSAGAVRSGTGLNRSPSVRHSPVGIVGGHRHVLLTGPRVSPFHARQCELGAVFGVGCTVIRGFRHGSRRSPTWRCQGRRSVLVPSGGQSLSGRSRADGGFAGAGPVGAGPVGGVGVG